MSVNVYDPINDKLIPVAGATLYAEMPLGAIQAFDSTDIPSNFLEFKGQTVNRADYPDLWAHIVKNSLFGEGKFYGIGDGATTFTLADLRETSLKGYGETSRSVGAHVKSGGLGVGEFIDDRVQAHTHSYQGLTGGGNAIYGNSGYDIITRTSGDNSGRTGPTTEVKAVGVVWAVKARMTGLPIDLAQQINAPDSSWVTQTNCLAKIKNGIIFVKISNSNSTVVSSSTEIAKLTDTKFIPISEVDFTAIDNQHDTLFHARITPTGSIIAWSVNGGSFTTASIYGIVSYPREQ